MSGECNCNYATNLSFNRVPDLVHRIKRIAAFLGISAAEIDACHMSFGELIAMAQQRAHEHPHLWAFLRATYANTNFSQVLSRLSTSGNSNQIGKIIEMANNGCSSVSAENYVDELLESQNYADSTRENILSDPLAAKNWSQKASKFRIMA